MEKHGDFFFDGDMIIMILYIYTIYIIYTIYNVDNHSISTYLTTYSPNESLVECLGSIQSNSQKNTWI